MSFSPPPAEKPNHKAQQAPLRRISGEEGLAAFRQASDQKISSITLVGGVSTISGCWNMYWKAWKYWA